MRRKYCFVVIISCLLLGGLLIAYPFFCNYVDKKQSRIQIQQYEDFVKQHLTETEKIVEEAQNYNQSLIQENITLTGPFFSDSSGQEIIFDGSVSGISLSEQIGYLEIPCIDVRLPVYEGTGEEALTRGAGHLTGTSFPIGGESTHTVIAGHAGMHYAKLFTDLPQMKEGDVFYLHILNRTLTYCVSVIETVLPQETDSLAIQEGEDLCTLVTCTPYGVNTHRLLVTGKRIYQKEPLSYATSEKEPGETGNNYPIEKFVFPAGITIGVLCLWKYLKKRKRRRCYD